jgi:hypothetical protein
MYKIYVMNGMLVSDVDAFISKFNRLGIFKEHKTTQEIKDFIKSQPCMTVKSLHNLTDTEMAELHFLMVNAGGFEDMVDNNNLESETKN